MVQNGELGVTLTMTASFSSTYFQANQHAETTKIVNLLISNSYARYYNCVNIATQLKIRQ